MLVTINTLTRCAGEHHYHFAVTVGGQSRTLTLDRADLQLEPDELRDAFIARVRSYVKENNITTFGAAKTALEGQTVEL